MAVNCTFSNVKTTENSPVYSAESRVTLINTIISNNSGAFGGGLYLLSSHLYI